MSDNSPEYTAKTENINQFEETNSNTVKSKSTINFTIQIGVFSASMGVDNFKNIGQVTEHIGVDSKYRYLYGTFDSYAKAKEKFAEIIKLGYSDAFNMNIDRYKK